MIPKSSGTTDSHCKCPAAYGGRGYCQAHTSTTRLSVKFLYASILYINKTHQWSMSKSLYWDCTDMSITRPRTLYLNRSEKFFTYIPNNSSSLTTLPNIKTLVFQINPETSYPAECVSGGNSDLAKYDFYVNHKLTIFRLEYIQ